MKTQRGYKVARNHRTKEIVNLGLSVLSRQALHLVNGVYQTLRSGLVRCSITTSRAQKLGRPMPTNMPQGCFWRFYSDPLSCALYSPAAILSPFPFQEGIECRSWISWFDVPSIWVPPVVPSSILVSGVKKVNRTDENLCPYGAHLLARVQTFLWEIRF